VAVHVVREVHAASLPRRVNDPRDRGFEAFVMVADGQPQALEAAGSEAAAARTFRCLASSQRYA